jgi:hypothetical protein
MSWQDHRDSKVADWFVPHWFFRQRAIPNAEAKQSAWADFHRISGWQRRSNPRFSVDLM